jgi:poly(3-hydroxybutyrate) depolymerase
MIRARTAIPLLSLLSSVALACSSNESANGAGPGGISAQGSSTSSAQASVGGMQSSSAEAPSSTAGTASSAAASSAPGTAGSAPSSASTAASAASTAASAATGSTSSSASTPSSSASTAPSGSASGGTDDPGDAGDSGSTGAGMSDGCTNPKTLQNGTHSISSGGAMREYILRVPDGYDNNHPYRLVFAFAESGASAQSVADRDYFTLAALDSENTIFVAPDAANGMGSWSQSDLELTDAILAQLEADLCIDTSRIFATGFSFGGAMSLAIACQRADVFRGVAFFSGADLTGSCTGALTKPIAYYASQASGDSSGDPIPTSGRIKQAQFAEVNGCMPEPNATTFPAAGQPHTCTEYKGCSAGHPTKYCVFNGAHGWDPKDPGQAMSWNAPEAWKFITQF